MLSLITVFFSLLIALFTLAIYRLYFHPLSSYPGPFLARLTDLHPFLIFLRGSHHISLAALHARYGPIVRIGPNALSFSALEAYEAIYGFNPAFVKGSFYDFSRNTKKGKTWGDSVFAHPGGKGYSAHRKVVIGPALTSAKTAGYAAAVERHAERLASKIGEAKAKSQVKAIGKESTMVDIASTIHDAVFAALLEIIYGQNFSSAAWTDTPPSQGLLSAFRDMAKFAWGAALWPALGWLMATRPMVYLTRLPKFDAQGQLIGVGALVARTRQLIIEKPELSTQTEELSFVKAYLLEAEKGTGRNQDEIWAECFNFVFAGPGSTSAALTSTLWRLATPKGQAWQRRIREEMRDGTGSQVLTAVLKETMRLHAPFPTAFPRTVMPGAETAIPGLKVPLPVGATVSASTYVLGRQKDIWGDDAEEWQPERWLGDEEKRKWAEERFVAFSKGARTCVGKEVAWLLLEGMAKEVLRAYNLRGANSLKGNSWIEMQYETCKIQLPGI